MKRLSDFTGTAAAILARYVAKLGALALTASLLAGVLVVPPSARASSHREAPFISEDPAADNTDVYAFVSYEPGRQDFVTIIGNWVPLQEPANGPNFFKLSDFVNYDLLIDVDGDALPDLIYRFDFITRTVDPGTYLYATGVLGPPLNPADPSSQYINLNQPQSYTLREYRVGKGGGNDPNTSGDQSGRGGNVLLSDVRTAPYRPGPKTLLPNTSPTTGSPGVVRGDTSVAYQNLAQMAVHTIPNAGGARAFVGPRDEGFFVDLGTAFDRINPRAPGADGTDGFNVSTLAVEIPKSRLRAAGDTDGIIGVWAASSRVRFPVCHTQNGKPDTTPTLSPSPSPAPGAGATASPTPSPAPPTISDQNTPCTVISKTNGTGTQVSRQANPLFSEFLNPIRAKDYYNAIRPKDDELNIAPYILNPAITQGPNTLVQQLRDFTQCTDTVNRQDQIASWMLGYPPGVVNGFPGNRETQTTRPAIADLIRLNYNIPPKPFGLQDPMGVLNGDFAGMPNGRRVADDSVDILLRIWGGELQDNFGGNDCSLQASRLTDNVATNDVPFLNQFPYLGLPQEGFSHRHRHEDPVAPTP
ncbi:MAG TPA: DUF4331 domain-containing protein [Pyrinomonadaceae bacterium]